MFCFKSHCWTVISVEWTPWALWIGRDIIHSCEAIFYDVVRSHICLPKFGLRHQHSPGNVGEGEFLRGTNRENCYKPVLLWLVLLFVPTYVKRNSIIQTTAFPNGCFCDGQSIILPRRIPIHNILVNKGIIAWMSQFPVLFASHGLLFMY